MMGMSASSATSLHVMMMMNAAATPAANASHPSIRLANPCLNLVMSPFLIAGDMLYFHLWQRSGFIVDIAQDIRRLNDIAMKAKKSGIVILGGGLIKHHICNANLMRNGADYAVFINTASDYDGSDTGARPDEAVSWGKIKMTATPVKIYRFVLNSQRHRVQRRSQAMDDCDGLVVACSLTEPIRETSGEVRAATCETPVFHPSLPIAATFHATAATRPSCSP